VRILLSNDDGIMAPGLAALHAAVRDMGEITVVAPNTPQSAAAHGITLRRAMAVRPVELEGFTGLSVDGRPADCVRLAIRQLLGAAPDLVLSGINAGANVGINVFYSGTVAAAAEAAMMGIPAAAFSASLSGQRLDFAHIARLCRRVLDRLVSSSLAGGDLINVNIPALDRPDRPCGIRVVKQSVSEMEDVYHREVADDGTETWRLSDKYRPGLNHHDDSDVMCLYEGYVTVTPLRMDMTRHQQIAKLAQVNWEGIG
jgi:5'-nucleotidase